VHFNRHDCGRRRSHFSFAKNNWTPLAIIPSSTFVHENPIRRNDVVLYDSQSNYIIIMTYCIIVGTYCMHSVMMYFTAINLQSKTVKRLTSRVIFGKILGSYIIMCVSIAPPQSFLILYIIIYLQRTYNDDVWWCDRYWLIVYI